MKSIKFNAEMVNAILEGRKTQTRRVIKVQPDNDKQEFSTIMSSTDSSHVGKHRFIDPKNTSDNTKLFNNPFGNIGDKLFVKEDFNFVSDKQDGMGDCLYYKADMLKFPSEIIKRNEGFMAENGIKWTSAHYMKQNQSRITLEITDIRVERLQDISDSDCWAEGISDKHFSFSDLSSISKVTALQNGFKNLWNSICKKDTAKQWEANPFVWVIEFKVV